MTFYDSVMKVDVFDRSYAEGMGYAWGRIDAGQTNLRGWEANFAGYWAEICASPGSRPSIQGAFDAWQRLDGPAAAPEVCQWCHMGFVHPKTDVCDN